tara:strand:- start:299 stop:904 length:606 start_codon:yes stop_codon:yes gene_type:complete
MEVNHRTLAPIHCASTDETRHNINTLSFESSGETIATSGHILARFIPSEKAEPGLCGFVVGVKSIAELNKSQRKKTSEPVTIDADKSIANGHVLFESPDPEQCDYSAAKRDDVEYPNWRQVHPYMEPGSRHAAHHTVAISLAVLEPLLAAARQFSETRKGDGKMLRFEFGADPETAFVATVDDTGSGDRLEFVVMPMRLDK